MQKQQIETMLKQQASQAIASLRKAADITEQQGQILLINITRI
jgi:hypothetical protein